MRIDRASSTLTHPKNPPCSPEQHSQGSQGSDDQSRCGIVGQEIPNLAHNHFKKSKHKHLWFDLLDQCYE